MSEAFEPFFQVIVWEENNKQHLSKKIMTQYYKQQVLFIHTLENK